MLGQDLAHLQRRQGLPVGGHQADSGLPDDDFERPDSDGLDGTVIPPEDDGLGGDVIAPEDDDFEDADDESEGNDVEDDEG